MEKFIEVTNDATGEKTAINPDKIVSVTKISDYSRKGAKAKISLDTKISLDNSTELFVRENLEEIQKKIKDSISA